MTDKDFAFWSSRFSTFDEDLAERWPEVTRELRERCPITHSVANVTEDDQEGTYILSSYEDILNAHLKPEVYSSRPVAMPTASLPRPWIPIESDPPLHKKYRAIVANLFSKASQNAKEEEYRGAAVEILERLQPQGECDLFQEFCLPYPSHLIMDAFAIPREDREQVAKLLLFFVQGSGSTDDPEVAGQEGADAFLALSQYLGGLIDERRGLPGQDLLSVLARAEIDGVALTDREIVDFSTLVIPAGYETTAYSLSYLFRLLDTRPDIRSALIDDSSLIPDAVDELLRYETPTRALDRTVMVDHEVKGVQLKRGDRVTLLWAAANRDPKVFDRPDEFILGRHPNKHFGFGWGEHLCAGLHMARLEMRIATEELLRRMPDYRIVDHSKVKERPGTTWSIPTLPIAWTPTECSQA